MERTPPKPPGSKGDTARAARLAAALKANIARRKAQGRARAAAGTEGEGDDRQDDRPTTSDGG